MKFFIVVKATGELKGRKRYESFEEAKQEAIRLSQKERAKFHVLGCLSTVDIKLSDTPVQTTYEAPGVTSGSWELQGSHPVLAAREGHQEDITGALRGVGAQVARSGIGSQAQEKD